MAMIWEVRTTSEERLKDYVQRMRADNLAGGLEEGTVVVRISEKIAVKYGFGVTAQEFATLEFAHQHINQSIVRTPEVYRFFTDTSGTVPIGYIFMEYFRGWTLDDLDLTVHTDIIPRVASIITHFGTISGGQVPGPIGGGKLHGYLWGIDGTRTVFTCIEDMNTWLNKRLEVRRQIEEKRLRLSKTEEERNRVLEHGLSTNIDLTSQALVFCHLDLCRRNMIMLEDRSICVVDFGCAGLFPRFFEPLTLSFLNPYDPEYAEPLKQLVTEQLGITEEEKWLMELVRRVTTVNHFDYGETDEFTYVRSGNTPPPPPLPLPEKPAPPREPRASSHSQQEAEPDPREAPTSSPPRLGPGTHPPRQGIRRRTSIPPPPPPKIDSTAPSIA
ncbi:hypothetical protein BU16DRAFT_561412 [Lophium mytilinum]|uniref:Aminoglycoside phosphotransferase domain-containing protein n=1 Tax=Lophium mytilinum TaxID=390894 RepID=A0A6A6QVZ2_9PEZI|nr:hypothetical protein BU16DRAFT_561412 [Lophium mytilinum]